MYIYIYIAGNDSCYVSEEWPDISAALDLHKRLLSLQVGNVCVLQVGNVCVLHVNWPLLTLSSLQTAEFTIYICVTTISSQIGVTFRNNIVCTCLILLLLSILLLFFGGHVMW